MIIIRCITIHFKITMKASTAGIEIGNSHSIEFIPIATQRYVLSYFLCASKNCSWKHLQHIAVLHF